MAWLRSATKASCSSARQRACAWTSPVATHLHRPAAGRAPPARGCGRDRGGHRGAAARRTGPPARRRRAAAGPSASAVRRRRRSQSDQAQPVRQTRPSAWSSTACRSTEGLAELAPIGALAGVRVGEGDDPAEVAPAAPVAHEQREVAGRSHRRRRGRSISAPWIALTPCSPAAWASSIEPRQRVVVGQRQRRIAELARPLGQLRRAARRRPGTSRPSGSAARRMGGWTAPRITHPSRRPAEPAAGAQVVEDDHVAPPLAHQLPVAAAQRLGGPPAVLHQPGLAQQTRPLRRPPPPASRSPAAHTCGPGQVQGAGASARESGRAPPAARARASRGPRRPPAAPRPARPRRAPERWPRSRRRRTRAAPCARASVVEQRPLLAGRRAEALDGQAAAPRPGREAASRRTDKRQPDALGVRQRLAEHHPLAPAAAGEQPRGEHDRAQRAPAALGPGQQPVDEHPQHALQGQAASWHRPPPSSPPGAPRRRRARSGASSPRASRWARTPGRAEAVGERRAPQLPELAQRAHARGGPAAPPAPRSPRGSRAARPAAGEPAPGVLPSSDQRPARAHRQRRRQRTEARRPGPDARGTVERAPGGGDRARRSVPWSPRSPSASK